MHVYILRSEAVPVRYYVRLTEDITKRLEIHNSGSVPHTSKFRPWKVQTSISFSEPTKATAFEKYLKSGSGRVFSKRHF
ncbi:MAG: GIY-YIG nuclease family protein [Pseudomonadota bacterium]